MICNVDAEQSLVAACMLDNKCLDRAQVSAMDFSEPQYQAIWQAMHHISRQGVAADVVAIDDYLGSQSPGVMYLAELARQSISTHGVEHCASIVRDKARRRVAERALAEAAGSLSDPRNDLLDIIDGAQEALSSVIGHSDRKVTEVKGWVADWLDILDRRVQGDEREQGISTGIDDLDQYFTLKSPDLMVLAGESGMGKTVAASHILDAVTMRQGKPSIMFQLEMSKEAVWERVAASYSGARTRFMKRPNDVQGDDWSQLATAVAKVKDAPLVIDDRPALTMAQIRGESKRWRDHWGNIGVVIIDYVGIVQPEDRRAPREQQIAEIAKSAKQLAKDLDCPVVLMAQINRDNTKRVDKRPIVTDLRESAALQHNADIISLLYRDEHYNKDTDRRGVMEWIVAKNREGALGTVELVCDLGRSSLKPFTGEVYSRWLSDNPAPENPAQAPEEMGSF